MKKTSALLFFYFAMLAFTAPLPKGPNVKQATLLIDLYIENMEQYCAEQYNTDNYGSLYSEIFDSPQVDVTSDITGNQGSRITIARYLDKLKDSSMTVQYDPNFSISVCKFGASDLWGCLLSKKVKYRWLSKPIVMTEFVEIVENGSQYKIGSIYSDLVHPLEMVCPDSPNKPKSEQSKLVALAESEAKNNNLELAAAHYEQAKANGASPSPLLDKRLRAVNQDSLFSEGMKKGNQLLEQGRYEEALYYYENLQKAYTHITPPQNSMLQNQIKKCRDEIRFARLVNDGDFHWENATYDKAKSAYEQALLIKSTTELSAKKEQCEAKIQELYVQKMEKDIKRAEYLLLKGGKLDEGFDLLMQYRYSGRLSGLQFFLMAQMLNSSWDIKKNTLKKYNLTTDKHLCTTKRQFMLNAMNAGYQSENLQIFIDEIFKKKDRKCK